MKKLFFSLLLVLVFFTFTKEVKVVLLESSDIHGRLFSYKYAIDEQKSNNGLTRIATLVKQQRAENENVRGYNYDMFAGVNYKVDITKPDGEKIVDATINGKPIDPKTTYKLAVNNYKFGTISTLGLVTEADKYYD
ncbi:5'-nucleotidase C-terminal domain-containing protein [Streptobacillus canis]|uniref:5'-nucleotidase C-terminal domain-containing protein n=1 Tax=Streptobacillus canis TaxID=2678686 RepID=UPI0018CC4D21|nr:5'-nucleotidase C-terminal domain-containing protein [Streptobacillus canis]